MYFLLHGEDTFSIHEKVKAFKQKFEKDANALFNYVQIKGANLTKASFIEAVMSVPFLMEKKLIRIDNLLLECSDQDLKKYITESLEKIPESSVVLFVENGKPDMRTSLFKKLNKPKVAQYFPLLDPISLKRWIKDRVFSAGGSISLSAITRLEIAVGSDLWRLDNEIHKLRAYSASQAKIEISEEDVEKMVVAENQSSIFDFVDALASKKAKEALSILHRLISSGENELYILSMIVYQFRNLLIISNLLSSGTVERELASAAKLHPFVAKKTAYAARLFSVKQIEDIFLYLEEMDFNIKTGQIDPKLALDLLVVDICKK